MVYFIYIYMCVCVIVWYNETLLNNEKKWAKKDMDGF